MPLADRKLSTATLRHQIVQEVRSAIVSGTLLPGERLVERELASRLGTSLTAAREAIIQLEAEGLITKRPNSTTHVMELGPEDVAQIFAVRRLLEEYAFTEAARHGTPAEIARLGQIHAKALKYAVAGDARGYIEQDLAWHDAVRKMSRNEHLYDAIRRAVLPLFGFSLVGIAMQEGFDLVEDARNHEPLLEGIVARDADRTRKAYRAAADTWTTETQKATVRQARADAVAAMQPPA